MTRTKDRPGTTKVVDQNQTGAVFHRIPHRGSLSVIRQTASTLFGGKEEMMTKRRCVLSFLTAVLLLTGLNFLPVPALPGFAGADTAIAASLYPNPAKPANR